MKQLLVILVVAGVLLNAMSNSFILAHYEMNKEYISSNLCENKTKPMMHCNGKCHLRKQLAKQEKKNTNPFSQELKKEFQIQYFSATKISALQVNKTQSDYTSHYSFFIPATSVVSIFHPPQLIA